MKPKEYFQTEKTPGRPRLSKEQEDRIELLLDGAVFELELNEYDDGPSLDFQTG